MRGILGSHIFFTCLLSFILIGCPNYLVSITSKFESTSSSSLTSSFYTLILLTIQRYFISIARTLFFSKFINITSDSSVYCPIFQQIVSSKALFNLLFISLFILSSLSIRILRYLNKCNKKKQSIKYIDIIEKY